MQARAGRHNGALRFVLRSANLGDVVGVVDVYLDSWREATRDYSNRTSGHYVVLRPTGPGS